ncbi:MAG: DUF1819 family protein [Lachnospiraceae bacterium]|nr:DUF1819 family protein [Lachnospiraceae bacterium]
MPSTLRYSSWITSGSLLLHKTKTIANLLLSNVNVSKIASQVEESNILQIRTESGRKKCIQLILNRIKNVNKKYLYYISNGTFEESSLLLLLIIANKNRIFGDFLRYISSEYINKNIFTLDKKIWNKYIDQCLVVEPSLNKWAESTRKKVKQVVFSILYDTKIIDKKTLAIQTVRPPSIVQDFLNEPENEYVRACVQGIFI